MVLLQFYDVITTSFDVNLFPYSREFTHRVKSVSLARFTTQEVEALQRGGNQVKSSCFWDLYICGFIACFAIS